MHMHALARPPDAVQVYANVQQRLEPGQIAYDLKNTKHWMPLFGSGSSAPDMQSIQVCVSTRLDC